MKKRFLSVLLTLCLAGLTLVNALAAEPEDGLSQDAPVYLSSGSLFNGVDWDFNPDTGVLTLSGHGDMGDFFYDTDRPWYAERSLIEEIIIEPGITRISDNAFKDCVMVSKVTIPNTVTEIGERSFNNCKSLENIELPNSITNIEDLAFQGCTSLKYVEIPGSMTTINEYTFSSCGSLQRVTLSTGIKGIMPYAFYSSSIREIIIPKTLSAISDSAFEYTGVGTVYYTGKQLQWENIEIGIKNRTLEEAQIYYEYVPTIPVTGVSLDKTALSLSVGDTAALTAAVVPKNASNPDVTWTSGDSNVAVVDSSGNITAIGAGNTTITVTTADGNKTAACTVVVTPQSAGVIPVTGVTLNKTALSLTVGGSAALTATVSPSNASNKNVTWTSSNSSVAAVANGTVKAVKAGTAVIIATTSDGGFTAICEVTVSETDAPSSKLSARWQTADNVLKGELMIAGTTAGKWYMIEMKKVNASTKEPTSVYVTLPGNETDPLTLQCEHGVTLNLFEMDGTGPQDFENSYQFVQEQTADGQLAIEGRSGAN